ncbi:MAG: carboxypeptidase regulatory-like domain-containing protein, partial [Candidatus Thermoplasmatota archaeon]
MTAASAPCRACSVRRPITLGLGIMIVLSSIITIGWQASAQGENVFVDGYVKESGTGNPIWGATVFINPVLGDGGSNITVTDVFGYYNMSIYTPNNNFEITAFHENYTKNSTIVFLSPWNNQTNVNITLDPASNKNSSVNGQVLDAVTLSPIPSIGVLAWGDTYINTTVTALTGNYTMDLESNQNYTIQVEIPGYLTERRSAYFGWGENRTINFLMEPMDCVLKGYVWNATGNVTSATVRVYRLGEYGVEYEYFPPVNATWGYYELNLTRGVWQVEVTESGHYTQALTVLMLNNQTTWQNFTLYPLPSGRATVQGYVNYYDTGSGYPFAWINAGNSNGTWSSWTSANATGWYNLSVIPGQITLTPMADGYLFEGTAITAVASGVYNLDLTLSSEAENAWLDGYVRSNGTGVGGVQVIARYSWRWY